MSRTDRQVQQYEDSTDDLDKRAERVVDHARELEQLREEKREVVREDNETEDKPSPGLLDRLRGDTPAKTGWIRDARLDDGYRTEYVLEIDVDEGNGDTTRFEHRLDWPDNIEEATVDNDVIKLAHLVGDTDNLDDILEQEVPVVERDGSYQLDLPASPSRRRRFTNWARRRLLNGNVLTYESGNLRPKENALFAGVGLISIPLLITGGTTLYTTITAFEMLAGGIIASGIAVLITLFVMVLVASPIASDPHSHNDDGDAAAFAILGLQIAVAAIYSVISPPNVATASESILSAAAFSFGMTGTVAIFVLGAIGAAMASYKAGRPLVGRGVRGLGAAKRWVQRRRGIDHLQVED